MHRKVKDLKLVKLGAKAMRKVVGGGVNVIGGINGDPSASVTIEYLAVAQ